MNERRLVVLGFLGSVLDSGFHKERWSKWRPTVSLAQHSDLPVARFELFHQARHEHIARCVAADIGRVSPSTQVNLVAQQMKDPWDFEEVYGVLHDLAWHYPFRPDEEDYLVHITTGTHVQQICLFLLTESRHFPARLVQTSPARTQEERSLGNYSIIDLDLSKYDRLAARFVRESRDAVSFLKSGIETRNAPFNQLIEQIEHVAIHARDPILLTGPTGAGKSRLARRIYELKRNRHQIAGAFTEVNCATLRGDAAMSVLFGHVKGAFTGAVKDRPGLLRAADGGVLFLDEIGELGGDEQAMLLRALEDKRFLPLGSDDEVTSDFQLIAGTNRDLPSAVEDGRFREDLLARINLWTFRLPGLAERPEDIEPNLDYELDQFSRRGAVRVTMNREARDQFLAFARSPEARWTANFRDLNACVTRMATLAPGGRLTPDEVEKEIARLKTSWAGSRHARSATASTAPGDPEAAEQLLAQVMSASALADLDLFDRIQLAGVIRVCQESATLSEAGRRLFAASRVRRSVTNDADRLRKYLARFGLDWSRCREPRSGIERRAKTASAA
ncbi:MAG: sigma 54-interacting transcriptional regulator [Verrucomicrobiales bacterium]|nr:sigma 54-interacting transcriptional regulator [Verrucomicrobiales bacterium]